MKLEGHGIGQIHRESLAAEGNDGHTVVRCQRIRARERLLDAYQKIRTVERSVRQAVAEDNPSRFPVGSSRAAHSVETRTDADGLTFFDGFGARQLEGA